ncbi:MAG: hypothetical protein VB110_08270 [Bacteroidales bacterium]|nr:hypothetical protein [Bacteroidales bacterium]
MRKTVAIIILTLLMSHTVKAQEKDMLSMQVSFNQIEWGLQRTLLNDKFWAELYAGVGNQDMNSKFDDFTTGFGVGFIAFSTPQNQISMNSDIGIYCAKNDVYSVTAPFVRAGVRYARFWGKTGKHGFLIRMGYQYGKRDYKQAYSSDNALVSTIGTFKVAPLYFSIGYGFRF